MYYSGRMIDPNPKAPSLESDGGARSELTEVIAQILRADTTTRETMQVEAVSETEVMDEVNIILDSEGSDLILQLQQLRRAQSDRERLLKRPAPWPNKVGNFLLFLGSLATLALLGVGVAKLFGLLLRWPLWPFVTLSLIFLAAGVTLLISFPARDRGKERAATVAVEDVRTNLNAKLKSLVIDPAVGRAASIKFIAPPSDKVHLTNTQGLSSRIESGRRIITRSYADVVVNLSREGGATIGLAGTRGVGKSELLQAFCSDSDDPATIEAGHIIGINIPAPVAYDMKAFLRLLIYRLAEAVPGYDRRMMDRLGRQADFWWTVSLLIAAGCLASGLAIIYGLPHSSRNTKGSVLIAIAILITLSWAMRELLRRIDIGGPLEISISASFIRIDARIRHGQSGFAISGIKVTAGPMVVSYRSADAIGDSISQDTRRDLAITATDVARRVRYLETRSANSEASASWRGLGLKRSSGLSLGQVPLAEPDLILELSNFVNSLRQGTYQVRIGIDELDKLIEGDDAEKFLNGMKALFAIHGCSFLLSISQNALSHFARRGMPIRDVFDSSLDAVVVVQPLTFREARRLIRTRLTTGYSDRISDSQVALCYCLAGGLPRDFLRLCRKLGEVNSATGVDNSLDKVMGLLLGSELSSRIDGLRFAVEDEGEAEAVAAFIAELEIVHQSIEQGRAFGLLEHFLANDASFTSLCLTPISIESLDQLPQEKTRTWTCDSRRQLFTYIYFAETVREAFYSVGSSGEDHSNTAQKTIDAFEYLCAARHQMEMDPAGGWRAITSARLRFGLPIFTTMGGGGDTPCSD